MLRQFGLYPLPFNLSYKLRDNKHNFQEDVTKSKVALNATHSNASNIEMTLTIIPGLYLMEKDPMSPGTKLMW
jgi:hypothetical protein